MTVIDKPTKIRTGEELDPVKLEKFLLDSIPGLKGPLTISQFPSGFSNLTYMVNMGGKELVLRRPPHGTKAATAHDMNREFKVLSALRPVFPYCPKVLVYTEDPSVMGCPFYLMERIEGIIIRKTVPEGITLGPAEMKTLTTRLVETMAELHAVDYKAAGLGDFGKPQGYVRRQVEGWSKRYRNARTPDVPDGEDVMAWLAEKMPAESPEATVIHNDFKIDNVVLDPKDPLKIIGVLDWEMTTVADPLMDLACTLAYWVEAGDPPELLAIASMITHLPGSLTREQAVEHYAKVTGRVMDQMDFYYTFGLFRLAVIAQQIYYRFHHGQTQDKRFALLVHGVKALFGQARRVIENSKL